MIVYDAPLFRPPAEADSLILQATLGCSHNRCAFCAMYRSKRYRVRPTEDLFADIATAARLWPDTRRVFLADGDAFGLPVDALLAILDRLRPRLPDMTRVSAYATPANILTKTDAELAALRRGGLSLVYLGVESGDDDLLKRMRKGASATAIARAVGRARAAGIKVSATVILGLGGAERSASHIDATVDVINAAPPTYLSTLRLFLDPATEAGFLDAFDGRFSHLDDRGVLDEMDRLLAGLDEGARMVFRSDHGSNLLALGGALPRDRAAMRARIASTRANLDVHA